MVTANVTTVAPEALVAQFAVLLGVSDCEIEAGPVGFVIYGASPERTFVAARRVATFLREQASKTARIESPVFDADEPAASSWIATVRFAW